MLVKKLIRKIVLWAFGGEKPKKQEDLTPQMIREWIYGGESNEPD